MKVFDSEIADVKLIEPEVFTDARGFAFESWSARAFEAGGLKADFVQDNHSRSSRGVLRGLHYQVEQSQAKLVRVVVGSVYDVAVDLRRSSPSFGKFVGRVLSADNKLQLWIPQGFAHGFLCLEDRTELVYKCSAFYAPQYERTLQWCDPALAIPWPITDMSLSLSQKDEAGVPLARAEVFS